MKSKQFFVSALTIAACAAIITNAFFYFPPARAQSSQDDRESRIEQGLAIAPVPLNLQGKDGRSSDWAVIGSMQLPLATTVTPPALRPNSCPAEIPTSVNQR